MSYKRKVLFQVITIALLGLILVISYVFSPENKARREERYSLLDGAAGNTIIRIGIKQPKSSFALIEEGANWTGSVQCAKPFRAFSCRCFQD